jgi:hypothetical protein
VFSGSLKRGALAALARDHAAGRTKTENLQPHAVPIPYRHGVRFTHRFKSCQNCARPHRPRLRSVSSDKLEPARWSRLAGPQNADNPGKQLFR